jgi:hypothetical protein
MKLFKSLAVGISLVLALAVLVAPVFADCLATKAQCEKAWKAKKKAIKAREDGDFDQAAKFYGEAAGLHPQAVYQASYTMNVVGCILASKLGSTGQYVWDSVRGPKNAQTAYVLLDQVQALLDTAKACTYTDDEEKLYKDTIDKINDTIVSTQQWHDNQLSWLKSQVPEATPVPVVATVTP